MAARKIMTTEDVEAKAEVEAIVADQGESLDAAIKAAPVRITRIMHDPHAYYAPLHYPHAQRVNDRLTHTNYTLVRDPIEVPAEVAELMIARWPNHVRRA